MTTKRKARSRILAAVHEGARDLYGAGFIDKRRMAEFDALCLEPVPEFTSARIKSLRHRHHFSRQQNPSAEKPIRRWRGRCWGWSIVLTIFHSAGKWSDAEIPPRAIRGDLARKLVFLVGPRQVGKTTLAKSLMADYPRAQYLNWDVPGDRRVILDQAWSRRARLVILDEIHKMRDWKAFLKGAWDGRAEGQALLVTGSARMDTFRQSGASLAGRYVTLRLHPVSVREWCAASSAAPEDALERIIERGGFPEPFLAEAPSDAERWRRQYLEDLVREDVLEFSRVHELRAMRTFVEMLRERVGSPVSLASLARDLQVSPTTLARYLGILEALYVVFAVRPYHRNIARAILKEPKIYFFDTGLVTAGEGARFENACAAMLLAHVHGLQDLEGRDATLHYIRQKQGAEVDFALCEGGEPVVLAECKHSDAAVSRFLAELSARFPKAQAVQLVRELRQEQTRGAVSVVRAADWLADMAA